MKKIVKDNFRLEVYPLQSIYGFRVNKGDEERICEDLKKQIKRHCDEVGHMTVICDTSAVCSHCGYNWGEESDTYNGGCCDKDQENDPDNIKAAEMVEAFKPLADLARPTGGEPK